VILDAREVEKPVDLLLAANYLPPFYTRTPLVLGEKFGDGGVTDNAPYEIAFERGCDAVVLMTMKGESEGGIYKSTRAIDHEVPAKFRERVVVIRPRHRLPVSFVERRWSVLLQLIELGDLRTAEVLLDERHPQTDLLRAKGDSPTVRLMKAWRRIRGARGSAGGGPGPAEPVQP
jgi:hypothetical protein